MSRETDLAWVAGIVDGEGCILLSQRQNPSGPYWVLRVVIANTSLLMLNRVKEILGLGNIISKGTPRSSRHRMQWYWEASTKKAEAVLTLLEPYLVNKHEEARLALLSRRLIGRHGVNKPNPNAEELGWLSRQLSTLKRVESVP